MGNSIDNIITQIIKSELLQEPLQIIPVLEKGDVNQTFIVKTGTHTVIVRVTNEDGTARYLKEEWCLNQTCRLKIPSPQVIAVGQQNQYSYIILSFIKGEWGEEKKADKNKIWFKLGEYTKLIHSIPTTGFGEDLVNSNEGVFQDSWHRFLNYNITSLNQDDKLMYLGVLNPQSLKKVKKLFQSLKQKEFVFGLNHGDLSLRNTIVDSEDTVWLFDWGCAESNIIPHFDFGEILRSCLSAISEEFRSFINGYGLSWTEFQAMEDDIHTLMLLRVIDKLRWAIDRKPDHIEQFSNEVKKLYCDVF